MIFHRPIIRNSRILGEKKQEENKLRKNLEAAIASGDKNALIKAIKEAKMAGLSLEGQTSKEIQIHNTSTNKTLKNKSDRQTTTHPSNGRTKERTNGWTN